MGGSFVRRITTSQPFVRPLEVIKIGSLASHISLSSSCPFLRCPPYARSYLPGQHLHLISMRAAGAATAVISSSSVDSLTSRSVVVLCRSLGWMVVVLSLRNIEDSKWKRSSSSQRTLEVDRRRRRTLAGWSLMWESIQLLPHYYQRHLHTGRGQVYFGETFTPPERILDTSHWPLVKLRRRPSPRICTSVALFVAEKLSLWISLCPSPVCIQMGSLVHSQHT